MYDWAISITELQSLDIKIAKLQDQIKSIPAKKLECEQLFAAENQAFEDAKKNLKDAELKVKKLETEIAQIVEKKRNFQAKSTMIRNNDEYKGAMLQIELCDKSIKEQEEVQLELMMTLDGLKADVAERKTALGHARKRAQNAVDDLAALQQKCDAQIEKLSASRPELEAAVSPEILTVYNRLRSSVKNSKTQPCVVPLIAEACGRCRMKATAQTCQDVINGKIVICSSCGALIYLED